MPTRDELLANLSRDLEAQMEQVNTAINVLREAERLIPDCNEIKLDLARRLGISTGLAVAVAKIDKLRRTPSTFQGQDHDPGEIPY